MKDRFAKAIERGSAHSSLRNLIIELRKAIVEDEQMKDRPTYFFLIYSHIIHMLALGHNSNDIAYSLRNFSEVYLDEMAIQFHIKNAKSKYKKFVEIMGAIYSAKRRDYLNLGASEEEADACFNQWVTSEIQ